MTSLFSVDLCPVSYLPFVVVDVSCDMLLSFEFFCLVTLLGKARPEAMLHDLNI
jgi:hypothetical protein